MSIYNKRYNIFLSETSKLDSSGLISLSICVYMCICYELVKLVYV